MGKLTDNATRAFKRNRRTHVPAFFSWAQYVALALIPIVYFSYFIFNKPNSYTQIEKTLIINDTSTKVALGNDVSDETVVKSPSSNGDKILLSVDGQKVQVSYEAYILGQYVAKAYFDGNWSKVSIVGGVPTILKLYPNARVDSFIAYSCDDSICILGAKIDKDGRGGADESIQFTLVKQDDKWYYQGI